MKGGRKNKHKNFFDRVLESLFTSIEENAEEVLGKIGDFIFMKKLLKKYVTFIILATASLTIILYGLGSLIQNYFSANPGIVYLSLGAVSLLISWIYLKSK